jgi:hypothetical protein
VRYKQGSSPQPKPVRGPAAESAPMAATKPRHEWRGTIAFQGHEMLVRAYSAFGNSAGPTLCRVHRIPCEVPPLPKSKSKKKGVKSSGSKSATRNKLESEHAPAQQQLICSRCGVALSPEEVGLEATTARGLKVLVDQRDLVTASFEKSERVEVRPISQNDSVIAAVGLGRRFFLWAEPDSRPEYWTLFEALRESSTFLFVPLIAMANDKVYVGIIRPLELPPELYGEDPEEGITRKILVLDCVNDSNTLKDPSALPGFSDAVIAPRAQVTKARADLYRSTRSMVDPEECLDPKTGVLIRAVRRARRRERQRDDWKQST